jgi:cation transport ATPase
LADRLAQGFVPLVILVAIGAFAGHLLAGATAARAAMIAVSVLVVSCPCAFGVAASSALSLAVLRLANAGVLVKDPATLERIRETDRVVFDKTGTLTRGELSLVGIGWISREQPQLLDAVRALEENSKHPIGLALARLLPGDNSLPNVTDIIEVPGMGVTGTLSARRLAVGKVDLFSPPERPLPGTPEGSSRVWFGEAGETPAGYIDLADELRPESTQVIADLDKRGITTELLSGDNHETTVSVAARAGIPFSKGGLRPEEKASRIEELHDSGETTAFVGDGFNDAEALAASDAGVAMSSGADLALISAPTIIARGGLEGVTRLVDVSRSATRVLRGNFIWAFVYNLAFIPVAALGLLAPVYAAALMAVSSASVGLNSMRMRAGPAILPRPEDKTDQGV